MNEEMLNVTPVTSSARKTPQVESSADGEGRSAFERRKTGLAHFDFVGAYFEVREAEAAIAAGQQCAGQVGIGLARGNLRAFDDGARLVCHASADTGKSDCVLRAQSGCAQY